MKPTFDIGPGSYFGGKGAAGVRHVIINKIPAHQTFVSGFLGRCEIMEWKQPAVRNIGMDTDSGVIAAWSEAARGGLDLITGSFLEWDDAVLYSPDTFLYLDPPYLPEVRTSNNKYKFELTYAQHEALLTKILKLPCMVAISCYDAPLYATMLNGWQSIQFKSQTRGGSRIETLYMNYPEPLPTELHDRRFLGDNFRAREKGKRGITTIQSKIERLDLTEKARLLEWLRGQVTSLENARSAAPR